MTVPYSRSSKAMYRQINEGTALKSSLITDTGDAMDRSIVISNTIRPEANASFMANSLDFVANTILLEFMGHATDQISDFAINLSLAKSIIDDMKSLFGENDDSIPTLEDYVGSVIGLGEEYLTTMNSELDEMDVIVDTITTPEDIAAWEMANEEFNIAMGEYILDLNAFNIANAAYPSLVSSYEASLALWEAAQEAYVAGMGPDPGEAPEPPTAPVEPSMPVSPEPLEIITINDVLDDLEPHVNSVTTIAETIQQTMNDEQELINSGTQVLDQITTTMSYQTLLLDDEAGAIIRAVASEDFLKAFPKTDT